MNRSMVPTKPFAKAPGRRFVQLHGVRVLDVADASRAAALAFLEGTAGGWGRMELGVWLVRAYRLATKREPATRSNPAADAALSEGGVERVLLRTRERLIELLADGTREWSSVGFARHAVDAGLVFGVTDAGGALGYAPLDVEGMRLYDRVVSLFVADYLTRPRDYEGLSLCDECSELSFAWAPTHHRYCSSPPVESGIVLARGELPPLTSMGLGGEV